MSIPVSLAENMAKKTSYPYFDEVRKVVGAYGFRVESIKRYAGSVRFVPETTAAICATKGVDKKWLEFHPFKLEDYSIQVWGKFARQCLLGYAEFKCKE
jgi:hypothetical protein